MKIVLIKRNNILVLLFGLFFSSIYGQSIIKTKIWNNTLKDSIILSQTIKDDSITLFIDRNKNKWLQQNVNIKTVNYWINAPIKLSSTTYKKNIIIKRTFLGNNIVGDKLYFKKNKNKYYYYRLNEFEKK